MKASVLYRIASVLLLLFAGTATTAHATSFAQAVIGGTSPIEDNEDVSAFVSSGANSASAFVHPLSETMGASVSSDGSVFDVRASASHSDDWTCTGGCSALSGPLSVGVGIRGSSAMPQIGHEPGSSRTISGCIGQVHSALPGPSGLSVGAP